MGLDSGPCPSCSQPPPGRLRVACSDPRPLLTLCPEPVTALLSKWGSPPCDPPWVLVLVKCERCPAHRPWAFRPPLGDQVREGALASLPHPPSPPAVSAAGLPLSSAPWRCRWAQSQVTCRLGDGHRASSGPGLCPAPLAVRPVAPQPLSLSWSPSFPALRCSAGCPEIRGAVPRFL